MSIRIVVYSKQYGNIRLLLDKITKSNQSTGLLIVKYHYHGLWIENQMYAFLKQEQLESISGYRIVKGRKVLDCVFRCMLTFHNTSLRVIVVLSEYERKIIKVYLKEQGGRHVEV